MFSQLFGKYLVDNKVITKEQLDEVISKMENVRAKLGFIAVSEGIPLTVTAEEWDLEKGITTDCLKAAKR